MQPGRSYQDCEGTCWLDGANLKQKFVRPYAPAGVGKSVIVQATMLRAEREGHLGASFFFSRDADSRDGTLCWQHRAGASLEILWVLVSGSSFARHLFAFRLSNHKYWRSRRVRQRARVGAVWRSFRNTLNRNSLYFSISHFIAGGVLHSNCAQFFLQFIRTGLFLRYTLSRLTILIGTFVLASVRYAKSREAFHNHGSWSMPRYRLARICKAWLFE